MSKILYFNVRTNNIHMGSLINIVNYKKIAMLTRLPKGFFCLNNIEFSFDADKMRVLSKKEAMIRLVMKDLQSRGRDEE